LLRWPRNVAQVEFSLSMTTTTTTMMIFALLRSAAPRPGCWFAFG